MVQERGEVRSAVADREVIVQDETEVLARIRAYRMAADELLHRADVVAGLARDMGLSWAKIGAALGMSQQGATARYTTPGSAGYETWRSLGWVESEPSLPSPRLDPADAVVMGLDPFADDDPDWHDTPV